MKKNKTPGDVTNLTFALVFAPEMVDYIEVKRIPDPAPREITVVCPGCVGDGFTMSALANEIPPTDTFRTIVLKLHEYHEAEFNRDTFQHGQVWIGRCDVCTHIIYTSKWKLETALERFEGSSMSAFGHFNA